MRRPTCVEFSGFLLLFIVEPRTKNGAKNRTPSYSAVNDGTKNGLQAGLIKRVIILYHVNRHFLTQSLGRYNVDKRAIHNECITVLLTVMEPYTYCINW